MSSKGIRCQVRWRGWYYPFGELYYEWVSQENMLRFPGQYEDDQTGHSYNWHRHYEPRLGRYLQPDPAGLVAGTNLFMYAGNRPYILIDPTGLKVYSCEETSEIIREAGLQNLWDAFISHLGRAKYDFKANAPTDSFYVGGELLAADQFGNYLAGYAGWKAGGSLGLLGVRAGGVWYDFRDNVPEGTFLWTTSRPRSRGDYIFDWDQDSVEMINRGAFRAVMEESGIDIDECLCPSKKGK